MPAAPLAVALPSLRSGREITLLAEQESRESGYGFLDAEHLLVAAVVLCSGIPRLREVLVAHGVTPAAVRPAVSAFVGAGAGAGMRAGAGTGAGAGPGAADPEQREPVACSPAAARVLARAAQLVGPGDRLRPDHVLLAVLDGVDDPLMGSAHDVLETVGVDVRRLRQALRRAGRRLGPVA
ncbi:Clp protease N-terminal domain-containing protein [Curtobacterium sp. ISL-83]|uniref:Clp protease N-terminal domain-containing protein n=1 Tax=Curtobacterium sp. ISL-83 TaxID=2819145 RepID=UPI001BE55734|nr:Clp protease N-terminal domain-containing protein [Curtobacterium sp. ISL-83]MBT2502372.1 Clp protease N-terminal domain-containing protein [Curtobacterium sp. ISL-83]